MSDSTTVRINPQFRLQWEPAQNCHVLLFPEGMVQLNTPAAEILKRCQSPISMKALLGELKASFPDAPTLENDVRDFVGTAKQNGWLNVDEL